MMPTSIDRQFINLHSAIVAGEKTKALTLLAQLERDVTAEKCRLTEQLANAKLQSKEVRP